MVFLLMVFLSSCEEILEESMDEKEDEEEQDEFGRGTDHEKEEESVKTIPKDLSLVTLSNANTNLGSRVVLTDYVPPIRNQDQYGTCVGWATGYYARTMMYAKENNLSPADLEDKSNRFSPLDVYLSIDDRNADCGGTYPGIAFEVMQERGIATLATAPYENLGDCSQGPKESWTSEAANYKIESFRTVDHTDVEDVKSYLKMGRPVQISCKLGIDFFDVEDSEVIYNGDYTTKPDKHLYHAMVCVGYDDDKGANGAFQIVNSWGTRWGDDGFAWVDYDYFTKGKDNNGLVYSAYVIEGDKGGLSEDMVDEDVINPNYRVEGKDLMAIELQDQLDTEYDDDRYITYDVFNRGESMVPASDRWNIVYYYYNAYDPEEDFGILIYDYYTDELGQKGESGDLADAHVDFEVFGEQNWWNNIDVPSGMSVATAAEDDGYEYNFEFGYMLPDDLDGEYYFVLLSDGFNTIEEQYEQNNFRFFTGQGGDPVKITDGVVEESSLKSLGNRSLSPGELNKSKPNAYSIDEIKGLIRHQKKAGILDSKAREFLKNASNKEGNFRGKRTVKVD
ncbi:MAG: C1 family peptidase [Bacteroidota bacterium]